MFLSLHDPDPELCVRIRILPLPPCTGSGSVICTDAGPSINKQKKLRKNFISSTYLKADKKGMPVPTCRVRADLPTPPLPTMMTLCKEAEGGPFLDIFLYNYKSENSTTLL
jgi:hypothetical protein